MFRIQGAVAQGMRVRPFVPRQAGVGWGVGGDLGAAVGLGQVEEEGSEGPRWQRCEREQTARCELYVQKCACVHVNVHAFACTHVCASGKNDAVLPLTRTFYEQMHCGKHVTLVEQGWY